MAGVFTPRYFGSDLLVLALASVACAAEIFTFSRTSKGVQCQLRIRPKNAITIKLQSLSRRQPNPPAPRNVRNVRSVRQPRKVSKGGKS